MGAHRARRMKGKAMRWVKSWMVALAAISILLLAAPGAQAEKKANNPNSNAYGQPLGDWLADFWAWNMSGSPPDQALQKGNVLFITIPNPSVLVTNGDRVIGYGETALTVKPGSKLVLGILAWIGETYQDHNGVIGSHQPDDTPWPPEMLLPPQAEATITLDGSPLMTVDNMAKFYYGPADFKETIWYAAASSYGSTGAIWVQGIGIIIPPLSAGEHLLQLKSWDANFSDGAGHSLGWVNTWHISVTPGTR